MARYYGAIIDPNFDNAILQRNGAAGGNVRVPSNYIPQSYVREKTRLKDCLPEVYHQGGLNSCVANAVCAAYIMQQRGPNIRYPSRLFLYYNTRRLWGQETNNSAVTIPDTIRAINAWGICSEDLWPYNEAKFNQKPNAKAHANADAETHNHGPPVVEILKTEAEFKESLDNNKPVIFILSVYERCFTEAEKTGTLPPLNEKELLSKHDNLHAVVAVDYNDKTREFLILNSYGPKWGQEGYFNIPYDLIADKKMCNNCCTITFKH